MALQFDFPTKGRVVIENHIVGNDVYEICDMYLGNVLESKYTKAAASLPTHVLHVRAPTSASPTSSLAHVGSNGSTRGRSSGPVAEELDGAREFGEFFKCGSEKLCLREVFTSAWARGSLLGYICTYVFVRFSPPHGHREMYSPELNIGPYEPIMGEKWSENTQLEKGDSLAEGYTSELWDFTRISVAQNDLRELKEMWSHWDGEMKQLFYHNYGDMFYLLDIKKGDGKCIPWASLRELILKHFDMKRRVDVFTLSVYGLVVFPKALRHIDEAVTNLFDQLGKGITPVPAILAETFRILNACRRTGEGRFIGCAQLLLVWFNSHFWKTEKEIAATPRRDDISEERWMAILQNLQEDDIEWRAPWMVPSEILFRYGDYDWVPLLGIWGGIGYAPFLVLRQYRSKQFIPTTQGLAQSEFCYKGDNYKKKVREICNVWNRTYRMEGVAVNPMVTPGYNEWRRSRVNDNILRPNLEDARPIEEYLRVVPSELEIIKQDFEKKSSELEKKIEQLEVENVYLKLDIDVQKSEAENLRKGKRKVEEDLASLKEYYKRYHASVKTLAWVKRLNSGGKKSKKKRLKLISGRRSSMILRHERLG
ncbi:hypothetical protein CXB51_001150 [Gossypium anomalum]|uniref:DUF7745 domain-containing protein n=1 Tax=Gossypium anomalum TaxID=47600 RepID=A0A8J5Z9G2_9ROSI|nr:hypothetical protein CXB51_001150 [Gossypium anomalum]